MAIDNDSILIEIKKRNVVAPEDEPKVDSYISEMKQKALNYCKLSTMPDGMLYVIVNMVEQRMGVGMVESIKRGDTSISYKTADQVLSDFKSELNSFRKLVIV